MQRSDIATIAEFVDDKLNAGEQFNRAIIQYALKLYGAPDDWSLYEAQLQEFRRDHLVVAPNLRGFPPSDAPEAVEAYAMPRLLNDIHALLRHFRRERCILVSND